MSEKWAYFLRELGREHNDKVGKKCANLGEMTKVGLLVPHGFALCLDAYTLFMERTGAYDEMRELHQEPRRVDRYDRWNEGAERRPAQARGREAHAARDGARDSLVLPGIVRAVRGP